MQSSTKMIKLVPLTHHTSNSGDLLALEELNPVPFKPVRIFVLQNLRSGNERACHAVSCDEFLVPLSGSCRLEARSTLGLERYELMNQACGFYVPAGVWIKLDNFADGTILLIACSQKFEDIVYYSEPQI